MKVKEEGIVISQKELLPGIFDLRLKAEQIAASALPGQFLACYPEDSSKLLPRPISICEIEKSSKELRIVYRVSGKQSGTAAISRLKQGDTLPVLGPLGHGFPIEEAAGRRVLLFGGGIGIPPMLECAKALKKAEAKEVTVVLGYRDTCFLSEDFLPYANVIDATEDGSAGHKGTVLDALRAEGMEAHPFDMIFACGPRPMLHAVKEFAQNRQIACYLSMEERMACGIGACLACVCETTKTDPHSRVNNARICVEGPVFAAEDIVI